MSERHEKWTRVEPGTVIPAGQPWRVEYDDGSAYECRSDKQTRRPGNTAEWFVDSSWKPPLVLPTEPTWGIAVKDDGSQWLSRWQLVRQLGFTTMTGPAYSWHAKSVVDFIPLTDEQVARIEAAR